MRWWQACLLERDLDKVPNKVMDVCLGSLIVEDAVGFASGDG